MYVFYKPLFIRATKNTLAFMRLKKRVKEDFIDLSRNFSMYPNSSLLMQSTTSLINRLKRMGSVISAFYKSYLLTTGIGDRGTKRSLLLILVQRNLG